MISSYDPLQFRHHHCQNPGIQSWIEEWYNTPTEERERVGELGKQYTYESEVGFTAENMCGRFMKDMDKAFKVWKPRKRYEITKVGE